jgi:hypothetical protein
MYEETEIGGVRRNIIRLARRAAMDLEFRELCLENGARAYFELTGEALPERYEARFVEPGEPGTLGKLGQNVPPGGDARPFCLLPEYLPPTWLG